MAHLTNFSFEFFYKIFTVDASQSLLYHGAKKSKMTKNSNQGGGPALRCPETLFIYHENANFLFSVVRVVQGEAKTPEMMGCCRANFAFLPALKIGTFGGKWTLEWMFKASLFARLALYFFNLQKTCFFFAWFSTMPSGNCKRTFDLEWRIVQKNNFLLLCLKTCSAWKFLFLCSFLNNYRYPWTFERNSFFNKL